jgi:exodeoxyribonuclease-5
MSMSLNPVTLSDEQEEATYRLFAYLGHPTNFNPWAMDGPAGSGKTTVLASVAREIRHAFLCTLTGKAASVLRRKTGLPVSTIHAAFYQLTEKGKDAAGKQVLRFLPVHERGQLAGSIVLVDESSMINHEMARDILRTGAKVAVCGDRFQLPPVSGRAFFDWSDVTLKTIHRQALESPIIRQAHRVRAGEHYREDGDGFRVFRDRGFTPDEAISADVILCYTNATRHHANKFVRSALGLGPGEVIAFASEPAMCLKNAAPFGIFNGATYRVLRDFKRGDTSILIDVDGAAMTIPMVTWEGMPSPLDPRIDPVSRFDYGYAMTVHKAQGSEWDTVLLIDENFRPNDRMRWLYTAITRAAKQISVSTCPLGYVPTRLPF